MYKYIFLLWSALWLLPASAGPVGMVKGNADASVQRARQNHALGAGDPLHEGDLVRTGKGGHAALSFRDGTSVTLGGGSEFSIRRYRFAPERKAYAFDVHMQKGQAIYASGRLGKLSPQSVSFSTPRAVVGVRGTRFLVTVD